MFIVSSLLSVVFSTPEAHLFSLKYLKLHIKNSDAILVTIFDSGAFYDILSSVAKKKDRIQTLPSRSCPVPHKRALLLCVHKTMITILFKDCNDFSQNFYDDMINRLQLHMVKCPCGKSGCLIRHGHYRRKIKVMSLLISLIVQRVWCKECHHTHALIPSFLVPYSRILLEDQQNLLDCMENHRPLDDVMQQNLLIDENNAKYILRQFRKHWKQRLLSIGASVSGALTIPCLSVYSKQFMQIHRTRNILFLPPT